LNLNTREHETDLGEFTPSEFVPERLCLLIAVTLWVAYTLAPFEFSIHGMGLWERTMEVLLSTSTGGVLKLTGHLVGFFMMGVLFVAGHERSLEGSGFPRFLVSAAVFCVGLEFVQLLAESRHARMADLLCNFAGVFVGAKTSMKWNYLRALRLAMQASVRRHRVRCQAGLFIVSVIIWCCAAFCPAVGALKMKWNADYHLVIANESDGTRPWFGEIRYVGINDRPLTAEQIRVAGERFVGPAKNSWNPNLLVGYDFARDRTKEILPEGRLRSGDLAIQVPDSCEWVDGGGILIKESALLMTEKPAAGLTSAILSSGAFSVEALVRPVAEVQTGPARIVSLSSGIWDRNFSLGQEGFDAIFRVRNGINGPNGLEHALHVKAALRATVQHLVAVYDHGVSSFFRDGELLGPTIDLREPFGYLRLGLGTAGRAVGALFLTVTMALPAYSLSSFVRWGALRHLSTILITFCAGSLPYLAACLIIGGPWRWDLYLWLAGTLLLAYPLGCFYARGSTGADLRGTGR
jgi:hypothetical protein